MSSREIDHFYGPGPNRDSHGGPLFSNRPNRCPDPLRHSQHDHDEFWFYSLGTFAHLDYPVEGPLDLQAMLDGAYGTPEDTLWCRQNVIALRHHEFLPRSGGPSGGRRDSGFRDPPGPHSGARRSSTFHDRPSGGAFGIGGGGGGSSGGAFGRGGGGGGERQGGNDGSRDGSRGGASRHGSRGAQSSGAASRPTTRRSQTMPLEAAPRTKRYGDEEDLATR